MRWAGKVARMGEMINVYNTLEKETLNEKKLMGFNWLRIVTSGGLL
jgi:hypothetical protein